MPWPSRAGAALPRGGTMAAVPGRLPLIEPMLATPARAVPGDETEWGAEAKWDGARVLAYVSGGTVVLRGRSGGDVTGSYPEVVASLGRAAGRRTVILDGEITVFDGDRPSFAMLQRRMHAARPAAALVAAIPVTYVAFDLLWQARSLLRSPYGQRRALLDGLALAAEHVSVPPAFPGQARALVDASREVGLEGVVLKRLSSPYQPGQRSGDWLKIRHLAAADVLIGGWLPRAGARSHLAGSVLVGLPGPAGLDYLGSVGSGFAEAELRDLTARLLALEQPDSPFAGPLPADVARRARWTSPVLAAEVAYREITPAGRMRHPVWRGLRPA
jgi:bifunctional non-homologous end joining protein LigD